MLYPLSMTELHLSPVHAMPTGLCEDAAGEVTALIRRMAQGDGRALEEIFAIWGPLFLGISQRILGDPKDAAKAVRDTFIWVWRRAADYDPHLLPPFVWASTILRECCIARLQRQRRSAKHAAGPPTTPQVRETGEDPRVMPLDDWRRLRAALKSLSAEEYGCLENAVFLGYARSNHQAQKSLSSTVKTSLRHALDVLRHQLSRYEL